MDNISNQLCGMESDRVSRSSYISHKLDPPRWKTHGSTSPDLIPPTGVERFAPSSELEWIFNEKSPIACVRHSRSIENSETWPAMGQDEMLFAFETVRIGLAQLDFLKKRVSTSPSFNALFGYSAGPMTIRMLLARVPRRWRGRMISFFRAVSSEKTSYSDEFFIVLPDGGERFIRLQGNLFDNRFICVARDITTEYEAEKNKHFAFRQAMIANETKHRIRNIFLSTLVIVKNTDPKSGCIAQYREDLEGRIRTLASVQTFLEDNQDIVSIHRLLKLELAAFAVGQVIIRGTPIELQASEAHDFAIVVHELATNAAKYGALSTPSGQIDVSWTILRKGRGRNVLRFRWVERNGPKVQPPSRLGFGTTVLASAGASILGGTAALSYHTDGLRYLLTVDLAPVHDPVSARRQIVAEPDTSNFPDAGPETLQNRAFVF